VPSRTCEQGDPVHFMAGLLAEKTNDGTA